jgi:hypothetical protein
MIMQKWRALGRVHESKNQTGSMFSHASVPFAENIDGNLYRIYFSSRDRKNRSYTHSLVINIENPTKILELDTQPVLSPGDFGTFDVDGAMASWITQDGLNRNLYYIGWNNAPEQGIFRNAIGLAISENKGPFLKVSSGPILDRSIHDPGFTASCSVLKNGTDWRMWYLSCIGWKLQNDLPIHRYHIKEAKSMDGINWDSTGIIAIDFGDDSEYAISRPSVIFDGSNWRMWYSHRGTSYKIGYAESSNGSDWIRMDEKINPEDFSDSWSNEMHEYPHVFRHENQHFMLYNGDGYGKSGFGIAILESS